jgi:hypothetical protein
MSHHDGHLFSASDPSQHPIHRFLGQSNLLSRDLPRTKLDSSPRSLASPTIRYEPSGSDRGNRKIYQCFRVSHRSRESQGWREPARMVFTDPARHLGPLCCLSTALSYPPTPTERSQVCYILFFRLSMLMRHRSENWKATFPCPVP